MGLPPTGPRRVVLDTDIGTDVDDALALGVLLGSRELELVGVATVYGDTLLRARIAQRLLALAGRSDVPVRTGRRRTRTDRPVYWPGHEGSTLPDLDTEQVVDADDVEAGVRLLGDTVTAAPGEVTVLAVGPLTNVAAAIEADPAFVDAVAEIAIMGGSFAGIGEPAPRAEHNIASDPEAAAVVFASGAPIRVVGLDVTTRTRIGPDELAGIGSAGALGAELGAQVRQYWDLGGGTGNVPHDPLVAVCLGRPDLFDFVDAEVVVDLDSDPAGATALAARASGRTRVAVDVAERAAVAELVARIRVAGSAT